MDVQKKKRSPNFTHQEKNLLINIIANSYTQIIENKTTNQVSVSQKLTTWKKIEDEFNATNTSGNFRAWQNLKLFYENQKKEIRKKKAEEKSEIFKTGGGPPPTPVINSKDTDEILASIINDKTISGLSNMFDSDNLNEDHVANDAHLMSDFTFEIIDDGNNETIDKEEYLDRRNNMENQNMFTSRGVNNEENVCTENLRRPPAPVSNTCQLSTPAKKPCNLQRRRPIKTIQTLTSSKFAEKYDLLIDKRLILVEKQIASIDNDDRMKREKHKLEIELLKVKIKNNSK